MANQFQDIGREIRDAVLSAVESGDYSQLNSRITGSVGDAIDEVNRRLGGNPGARTRQSRPAGPAGAAPRASAAPNAAPAAPKAPVLYVKKPRGSVSGTVMTVFGAIFLGTTGMGLLVLAILALTGVLHGLSALASTGVLVPVLAGSAVLLSLGCKKSGRVLRFRRCVSVLRGRTYCAVSELAEKLGRRESFVRRDLQKMIDLGMFPQGHLDDEGKTLLLTDELYSQYRDLKRQRREAEQDAAVPETPEQKLYRETAEQGQRYLEAIRRANDAIPGEAVSAKLDRLENVVRRIFEQVKANPQQIPELRRFLDYYMPTTLKLVETYQELDRQEVAGENITAAKTEIEKTLDTINRAFENLFDSLFANTAVDISSDISVLRTMLKQEGLTDKDFT